MLAWLALGMLAAGRLEGQSINYLVQNPVSVGVSNSFLFNITVTNLAGSVSVTMTNTIVGTTFQLGSATFSMGSASVGSTNVVFSLGSMTNGQVATTTMAVTPTSAGSLSNLFSFATNGAFLGFGSLAPVVQVTNPAVVADLAVAITGPAAAVFTNDWMVYGVSVTNLGPGNATNVFLTNSLPPGVGYISVSPPIQRLGSGSNVTFNLGTLTSGAFINLQLTVQPTNAGTLTFVSVVSTNNVIDTNPTNNSASFILVVSNFLSNTGQLTATIVSTQKFNQLSGRLEQNVVLSNAGPSSVASARVTVTGLTNWLSNATGTNNGNPFVTYAAALAMNQSAFLLLQFYPNQSAFSFSNSQLQADGVSPPNLAPATNGLMPTNILLIARMPSGGIFLEFPTLTNRSFTVEYSSNLVNWLAAQPITVTPANYSAWIDYGPPATVSHPTNIPMRFYRVFLGP